MVEGFRGAGVQGFRGSRCRVDYLIVDAKGSRGSGCRVHPPIQRKASFRGLV